jgi:ribosomal protein L11 methyltransferase
MAGPRYLRVRATIPAATTPSDIDALADGFIAYGISGIEIQPDGVITYIECADGDADALAGAKLDELNAFLTTFTNARVALESSWLENQDWSREWRRGLDARRVGEHFVITPTWIEPEAQPSDVVITIDPQMAFGTGEHGTTRGMLRLMEPVVRPGDVVLDVGAGSAILSIAAAHLGAARVDAVEADPDAIENAMQNIERNDAPTVQLTCAFVDVPYLEARENVYDVILANVLSGVLRPLMDAFHRALRPHGHLLLSGILREEADVMRAAARASGFAIVQEDQEAEWWSVLLRPVSPA